MAFTSCVRLSAATAPGLDLGTAIRPRGHARAVVCASASGQSDASSRRAAVISIMSFPALLAASPARAAFIDVSDSRGSGAKESMQSADQARDDNEDERNRFAFESTQRLTNVDHQARAKESYKRLSTDIKQLLDKNWLNRVSSETRHQLGTLRYDLARIGAEGDKSARKAAKAQYKEAIQALEDFDLYARLGKSSEASQAYSDAVQKLGNIVKSYG